MAVNRMVRKQVYIEPEQDRLLKRRAAELGITESDLIRRSIDQLTRMGVHPPRDPAAGQRLIALLDELDRRFAGLTPAPDDRYKFSRDDVHDERLRRFLG
jgi:hypothetical protein